MSLRPGEEHGRPVRDGADEPVDRLVRGDPPDEEDTFADEVGVRMETLGVGAAVDDPRSCRRRPKLARRIGRYGEEPVEQPRQQAAPVAALQAVVRDRRANAVSVRDQRCGAARRGSHVMDVHDVGSSERAREPERERVRRVAAEVPEGAEDAYIDAGITPVGRRPEAHEPDVDVAAERSRKLERVPFTAAEDARRAEERRSDVNDSHLVLSLITLGDPNRRSGGYLYHLRMAEAAPEHDARIEFVSFRDHPFPLPVAEAPRLLRRVRELRPDALVVDSIAAVYVSPVVARARLPVIGSLHQPPGGIDHGRLRKRAQAPLDVRAWKRADLLIAASDHLAEQLVAVGLPSGRIRVVPPGRDVAQPPSGPLPDLRAGRAAAFLCVANWLPRKGILELLEALARLRSDIATLHLAGDNRADPRYARRVRARLADPDLAGRVVVHGYRSREEIAALYTAADAFVLPAFRDPYGTVWGEAMAFGVPVVGWRAANLPYLAEDEREALLVDPGDVDGLARVLARLVGDEALRRRLGEAGRARALSRPTWAESAALYFDALRDAVAGRQR